MLSVEENFRSASFFQEPLGGCRSRATSQTTKLFEETLRDPDMGTAPPPPELAESIPRKPKNGKRREMQAAFIISRRH